MICTDQLQRTVRLDSVPQRIVSLVPSITELLIDLQLGNRIVGRTKFCVHPAEVVKQIAKVGGTKQVHLDKIGALRPDLIIANKEENTREDIKQLVKKYPVWISDVPDFPTALAMILKLGEVLERQERAREIVKKSQQKMAALLPATSRRTAYLIWRKPYMTIGHDTYINDILRRTGYENVFGEQTRYPQFDLDELQRRQPEIILLSSEPFPFKEKHIVELREVFPAVPIQLVDGEFYSWYGTRFLKASGN